MRKYFAEAFGTFILVFAGTGAIVTNTVSHGTVTHPGIALVFGLVAGPISAQAPGSAVGSAAYVPHPSRGRFSDISRAAALAANSPGAPTDP